MTPQSNFTLTPLPLPSPVYNSHKHNKIRYNYKLTLTQQPAVAYLWPPENIRKPIEVF